MCANIARYNFRYHNLSEIKLDKTFSFKNMLDIAACHKLQVGDNS